MNKFYCEHCNKKVNYFIRKNIINKYKEKVVNVEENIAVCDECGNDIFIPSIENDNLKRLYSKYRNLMDIISKEDLTTFRKKYNLSQRELVSILGWGKMTINRYENGAIPSKSHSDILKEIISNEERFKTLVNEAFNTKRISKKTQNKIVLCFKSSKRNIIDSLLNLELNHPENILNGFRKFDIERVENLISYIASKVDNLYKTNLNKYLWFIDFQNFNKNMRSITGLCYVKQQYGPSIENKGYEPIIHLLDDKFYTNEIEDNCSNTIKTKILSKNNYELSLYAKDELQVIDSVINKLKNMNCSDISNELYNELGCIENDINDYISYDYAERLKMKF